MTRSAPRPRRSLSAAPTRRSDLPAAPLAWPIPIAGLIASAWAVVLAIVLMLLAFSIGWIATADPESNYGSAISAALSFWVLAHGSPATVNELTFGLTPLLLTLPILWGLKRGVRWAIRSTRITNAAGMFALVFSVAASYSVLSLFVSLTVGPDVRFNASRTLLASGLCAFVAAMWAITDSPGLVVPVEKPVYETPGQRTTRIVKALAPHDILVRLWRDIPQPIRHGILISARALTTQFTIAAAVTIGLLLFRSNEISSVVDMLADNTVDSLSVLILSALYVPTVIIWIATVLYGPGIMLGAGSPYGLLDQELGALPGFPFLAVLPASLPVWSAALMLLSLLASVLGSLRWMRQVQRAKEEPRLGYFLVVLISAGISSGFFGLVISLMATGALGAGRYLTVGPLAVTVACASTAWTLLGVLVVFGLHKFSLRA